MRRGRRGEAASSAPPTDVSYDAAPLLTWALDQDRARRPHYVWGVLQAALSAQALGYERVSAAEFGVAGGNGLVALEEAAELAAELVGVQVDVYGFDAGGGMPPPVDQRDAPWLIEPGIFPMDVPALRQRLHRAQLVLGNVADTVDSWVAEGHPPLAFASIDLDVYTGTVAALRVFDGAHERLLPRVVCYFDDVLGFGWSDFNGERAAIHDFNATHDSRKIGQVYGLRWSLPRSEFNRPWPEQIYLAHIFDSPRYNELERPLPDAWAAAHRLQPE